MLLHRPISRLARMHRICTSERLVKANRASTFPILRDRVDEIRSIIHVSSIAANTMSHARPFVPYFSLSLQESGNVSLMFQSLNRNLFQARDQVVRESLCILKLGKSIMLFLHSTLRPIRTEWLIQISSHNFCVTHQTILVLH